MYPWDACTAGPEPYQSGFVWPIAQKSLSLSFNDIKKSYNVLHMTHVGLHEADSDIAIVFLGNIEKTNENKNVETLSRVWLVVQEHPRLVTSCRSGLFTVMWIPATLVHTSLYKGFILNVFITDSEDHMRNWNTFSLDEIRTAGKYSSSLAPPPPHHRRRHGALKGSKGGGVRRDLYR